MTLNELPSGPVDENYDPLDIPPQSSRLSHVGQAAADLREAIVTAEDKTSTIETPASKRIKDAEMPVLIGTFVAIGMTLLSLWTEPLVPKEAAGVGSVTLGASVTLAMAGLLSYIGLNAARYGVDVHTLYKQRRYYRKKRQAEAMKMRQQRIRQSHIAQN